MIEHQTETENCPRDEQNPLIDFYQESINLLSGLCEKHGLHLQPSRGSLEEGAVHIQFTATREPAVSHYGRIWQENSEKLGIPSYFAPGVDVIDPHTGDTYTLVGLDPLAPITPVLLTDSNGDNLWMDTQALRELQPI